MTEQGDWDFADDAEADPSAVFGEAWSTDQDEVDPATVFGAAMSSGGSGPTLNAGRAPQQAVSDGLQGGVFDPAFWTPPGADEKPLPEWAQGGVMDPAFWAERAGAEVPEQAPDDGSDPKGWGDDDPMNRDFWTSDEKRAYDRGDAETLGADPAQDPGGWRLAGEIKDNRRSFLQTVDYGHMDEVNAANLGTAQDGGYVTWVQFDQVVLIGAGHPEEWTELCQSLGGMSGYAQVVRASKTTREVHVIGNTNQAAMEAALQRVGISAVKVRPG